jgi:hypothetical protein
VLPTKAYAYKIGDPADWPWKHKGALAEHPPPPETVYQHRNSVRDAEGHDRGREDGIEGTAGTKEDAAEDHIEDDGQDQGVKREFQLRMNLGKEFGKWQAPVSVSC